MYASVVNIGAHWWFTKKKLKLFFAVCLMDFGCSVIVLYTLFSYCWRSCLNFSNNYDRTICLFYNCMSASMSSSFSFSIDRIRRWGCRLFCVWTGKFPLIISKKHTAVVITKSLNHPSANKILKMLKMSSLWR